MSELPRKQPPNLTGRHLIESPSADKVLARFDHSTGSGTPGTIEFLHEMPERVGVRTLKTHSPGQGLLQVSLQVSIKQRSWEHCLGCSIQFSNKLSYLVSTDTALSKKLNCFFPNRSDLVIWEAQGHSGSIHPQIQELNLLRWRFYGFLPVDNKPRSSNTTIGAPMCMISNLGWGFP